MTGVPYAIADVNTAINFTAAAGTTFNALYTKGQGGLRIEYGHLRSGDLRFGPDYQCQSGISGPIDLYSIAAKNLPSKYYLGTFGVGSQISLSTITFTVRVVQLRALGNVTPSLDVYVNSGGGITFNTPTGADGHQYGANFGNSIPGYVSSSNDINHFGPFTAVGQEATYTYSSIVPVVFRWVLGGDTTAAQFNVSGAVTGTATP